jgi:hypothetical protein
MKLFYEKGNLNSASDDFDLSMIYLSEVCLKLTANGLHLRRFGIRCCSCLDKCKIEKQIFSLRTNVKLKNVCWNK